MDIKSLAYNKLNDYQKLIFKECIEKSSGGLHLPKGSGKTFLSMVVALHQTDNPILVICSKSLIGHWVNEISKFFEDSIKVQVCHSAYCKDIKSWKLLEDSRVVITTPDHIRKVYTEKKIEHLLIKQIYVMPAYVNFYHLPENPVLRSTLGPASLYSLKWGCVIIDESQDHLNIMSNKGRSLCLLAWDHLWLTSGDLLPDGKLNKVFCYHLLLRLPGPHNFPDYKEYIKSSSFRSTGGYKSTMVYRKENKAFIRKPILKKIIIEHDMTHEEKLIYTMFKSLVISLNTEITKIKCNRYQNNNNDDLKKMSTRLLVMISHLRQSLVSPVLPIANSSLKLSESQVKNEMAQFINNEVTKLGIYDWLDSEECVLSSRVKKLLELLDTLSNQQVVIFTSYRTSVHILNHFIVDRPIFNLSSSMTPQRRNQEINNFKESTNGVLILTYTIGSVGLNLQFCNQVILMDYEWSSHIIDQAICRVYRMGQEASEVCIYYMTSNTGIEKCVLEKQLLKKEIADALFNGNEITHIKSITLNNMVKMVMTTDNITLLNKIYNIY